jgi:hypothetical protein
METNGRLPRKMILLALPGLILVLMACQLVNISSINGSGKAASESRPVSGFNRISLRGTGDLTITQGDEEALTVEADDNILPYIKTEVRNGELILQIKEGVSINPRTPIRYTLKAKDLNLIAISGSGKVMADALKTQDFSTAISGNGNMHFGNLDAQDVAMDISGSGKMIVDQLKAQTVESKISGSGDFDLTGEVTKQSLNISGSGNYLGGDLKSSEAQVRISGSGDVVVWVEDALNMSTGGSGKVSYYGSPKVEQSVSGSGTIKSLGEHK